MAQDPSGMKNDVSFLCLTLACLVNWQYSVQVVNTRGVLTSRSVDACVDSVAVTMLNVFLWFTIWFIATWLIVLSTQSC
jgi:hypothetical protein